jgi:hypothetical protein
LRLVGAPVLRARLFLAERAYGPHESERPSDLLNGSEGFIPVVDAAGEATLLRREMLLAVSVDASEEPGDEIVDAPGVERLTRLDVEVVFDTGERLRGELAFSQPESRRRLGDYLNDCPQFFRLADGDTVHLVNKARLSHARSI